MHALRTARASHETVAGRLRPGFSSRPRRRARLFGEDCVWGSRINPGANPGAGEGNLRHPVTNSVGCSNDQPSHTRGASQLVAPCTFGGLASCLDGVFLTLSQYVLPPSHSRLRPFHKPNWSGEMWATSYQRSCQRLFCFERSGSRGWVDVKADDELRHAGLSCQTAAPWCHRGRHWRHGSV